MNNFFNTIPTEKGNVYFLAWLLNSTNPADTVCLEMAKDFIFKCYEFQKNVSRPSNIDKFQVLKVETYTIYCLVNDEDLLVIKTYMSDSFFRLNSSKHSDMGFIHEDEVADIYSAKRYLYSFLETEYIGNILQIEEETIYDIFPMGNYVDYLCSYDQLCDSQIKNELAKYEKNILDGYRDYNRIKYQDWGVDQHKGFFRALQRKLNDGEGKKDSEFGDLWYFDFFEVKKGKTLIYFRLKHNKEYLEIRAGFESSEDKKSQRKVLIEQIKSELENHNIDFKSEKQPGRSWYYTTLGTIESPIRVLDGNGVLDIKSTIQKLEVYKKIVESI